MKEIRGGGSRKNVGTCARLIRGGAAWGAVKGAGEGVTKGVPIGAAGSLITQNLKSLKFPQKR